MGCGGKKTPPPPEHLVTVKHNFYLVTASWDKSITFLRNGLAVQNWKLDIDSSTQSTG